MHVFLVSTLVFIIDTLCVPAIISHVSMFPVSSVLNCVVPCSLGYLCCTEFLVLHHNILRVQQKNIENKAQHM